MATVYIKSNLSAPELHKVAVETRLKGHLATALPLIVMVLEAADTDRMESEDLLSKVNALIEKQKAAGSIPESTGTWTRPNLTTKLQGLKKIGAATHVHSYENKKKVATYTVNSLDELLTLPVIEAKTSAWKKRYSKRDKPIIRNESTALFSGRLRPGTLMIHDRFHSGYLNAALRVNKSDPRKVIEHQINLSRNKEVLRIRTTTSTGGKDKIASLDDLQIRRHLLTLVRETYHHAVMTSKQKARSANDPSLEITEIDDLVHRWIVLDLEKASDDLNASKYKFSQYEERLDAALRRFHLTVQEVDLSDCPNFAEDLGYPRDTSTIFVRTINDYVRGGDKNHKGDQSGEEFKLDSDGTWCLDEDFDPLHAKFSSPTGFLYFRLNEYLSRGLALQVLTGDSDNQIFLDHPDMRGLRYGLINHLYDNLRGILNTPKSNFENNWLTIDDVNLKILKLLEGARKDDFCDSFRGQLDHFRVGPDVALPFKIEEAIKQAQKDAPINDHKGRDIIVSKIPSFYILRYQEHESHGQPWLFQFRRDPECEYLARADRLRNDELAALQSGDLIGIE